MYNNKSLDKEFTYKIVNEAYEELTIIARKVMKKIFLNLKKKNYKSLQNCEFQQTPSKQNGKNKSIRFLITHSIRPIQTGHFSALLSQKLLLLKIVRIIATNHTKTFLNILNLSRKMKLRFEETINILQHKYQKQLQNLMTILSVAQLRQIIFWNHRRRSVHTYKERNSLNTLQNISTKQQIPISWKQDKISILRNRTIDKLHSAFKIQDQNKARCFLEINFVSIKSPQKNLKEQLIRIKQETITSLESIDQLYNQIFASSLAIVSDYDQQEYRQRPIEAMNLFEHPYSQSKFVR